MGYICTYNLIFILYEKGTFIICAKKDKANGKYSFVYLYIYLTFIIYRINLVIIKNGQNDNPIDLANNI